MKRFPAVLTMRASRRGMTIVELIIVMGIIGMLIAMLLPALQKVRESARAAICSNNLHALGQAYVDRTLYKHKPGEDVWAHYWPTELEPYMDAQPATFVCPQVALLQSSHLDRAAVWMRNDWGSNRDKMVVQKFPMQPGNGYCRISRRFSDRLLAASSDAYVLEFELNLNRRWENFDDLVLLVEPTPNPANPGGPARVTVIKRQILRWIDIVNPADLPSWEWMFGTWPDNAGRYNGKVQYLEDQGRAITNPDQGGGESALIGGVFRFSYGMNSEVHQFTQDTHKILLLDYHKPVAHVAGPGALDAVADFDYNRAAPRHADLVNVLFAGGHVKRMDPQAIHPLQVDSETGVNNLVQYWLPRTFDANEAYAIQQ